MRKLPSLARIEAGQPGSDFSLFIFHGAEQSICEWDEMCFEMCVTNTVWLQAPNSLVSILVGRMTCYCTHVFFFVGGIHIFYPGIGE